MSEESFNCFSTIHPTTSSDPTPSPTPHHASLSSTLPRYRRPGPCVHGRRTDGQPGLIFTYRRTDLLAIRRCSFILRGSVKFAATSERCRQRSRAIFVTKEQSSTRFYSREEKKNIIEPRRLNELTSKTRQLLVLNTKIIQFCTNYIK